MNKLNEKRKKFVIEYLKDFNGTRAYMEAYNCKDYKIAQTGAWRLLRNVEIQREIQEKANKHLEEIDVDVNYIIKNIKEVTERCMQKEPVEYFDKEDKRWKYVTEMVELPDGNTVEARIMKFDANNSLKGLELLGKYKKIFNDDQPTINNNVVVKVRLTDD